MNKASAWYAIIMGAILVVLIQSKITLVIGGISILTTSTFPWICAIGLLLSGAILLCLVLKNIVAEELLIIDRLTIIAVMQIIIVLVVYMVLLNYSGFIIATILLNVFLSYYFGLRNIYTIAIFSGITPMILFYVFKKLLHVPLP